MSIGLWSSSELTVGTCICACLCCCRGIRVEPPWELPLPETVELPRRQDNQRPRHFSGCSGTQNTTGFIAKTLTCTFIRSPIKGYRHIHPGITFWVHRRPKLQLLLCVFVVNRIPCERCSSRRRTSGRSCASWLGSSTRGTSSSWRPEERRSPPNQVRESFSSLHFLCPQQLLLSLSYVLMTDV